jgi:hypothetical protein
MPLPGSTADDAVQFFLFAHSFEIGLCLAVEIRSRAARLFDPGLGPIEVPVVDITQSWDFDSFNPQRDVKVIRTTVTDSYKS